MFEREPLTEQAPDSADDAEWDAFVAAHPHGSLLQTANWARLKGRFGWSAERVWLRRDGQLVAGAQVLFRRLAWGLARIGYIPHGPLVDWEDEALVTVLLNQIDQAAYQHRAGMVKIEPLLWQEDVSPARWAELCSRYGCRLATDTIQPPRTMQIDLRPEEEAILAGMRQKTRYNIRLAGRKGVTVRQGGPEDLPLFAAMMRYTGLRNGFGVHAPAYYANAFALFAPDRAALLLAEFEGRPLAGVMVFRHGPQAAYLYGASSDEERQRMPSYAAQWAAIQWARRQGCTTYDLWGVPDATAAELEATFQERSDGLWGVYRFKRGFGGVLRRTVGSADRVYNDLLYRLVQWRRRGAAR